MSKPGFPRSHTVNDSASNTYFVNSTHTTISGTDHASYSDLFEDKAGDNTPNWPHAIRNNYYLRSKFTLSNPHGTLSATKSTNSATGNIGDQSNGDWCGPNLDGGYHPWASSNNVTWSTGPARDACRELLFSRLISKIQDNSVNLGEAYETRKQTVDLFVSTCRRFAGALGAARRGNFGGAARQLLGSRSSNSRIGRGFGGVPEWWLAYRYGWQPLIQDVYNSCETVRRAWNDNGDLITATAKATVTADKVDVSISNQPWFPGRRWRSTSNVVRGNASITYGVANMFVANLSQLGITNPLALAWELLPYSFVVDWMFPVGNFLQSLTYDNGLQFNRGYYTITSRTSCLGTLLVPTSSYDGWSRAWSGGVATGDAMVMERVPLSSFPKLQFPSLKDPFSPTHVANALSLLATAFDR